MVDAKMIRDSIDLLDYISKQTGIVYKKSATSRERGDEYHGPCPFCGGKDRFHIQPMIGAWWCRQCSQEKHFHDIFDFVMQHRQVDFKDSVALLLGDKTPDPDRLRFIAAQRAEEQRQLEEAAEREAQNIRAEIALKRPWERFSSQQTPQSHLWWEKQRAVPLWAQEAWFLGYSQNIWSDFYGYDVPEEPLYKHAYTIPYFAPGGEFVTMQARFEAVNGHGPYHNWKGLPMASFITQYQNANWEQVVVHEGAIKAMNGYIHGCGDKYQVLSVPSENTLKVVVPLLAKAKKVWAWLDPDTWDKPANADEGWLPYPLRLGSLIKEANPNCTVLYVKVNFKADDALHDGLTSQQYLRILEQAIPGRRIRL